MKRPPETTFMNVLMGKVQRTGGDLMINGIHAEMSSLRKMIGFVPQVGMGGWGSRVAIV